MRGTQFYIYNYFTASLGAIVGDCRWFEVTFEVTGQTSCRFISFPKVKVKIAQESIFNGQKIFTDN